MRIIDADALMERRKSVYIEYIDDEDFDENCDDAFVVLAKHINAAPTFTLDDIVPHGRWVMTLYTTESRRHRIISNKKFACSECGYSNGRKQSNYCPNCGAKMDLEEI